jgi:3-phosphoshikimate 1-carboxyvinyltransferase
MGAVIKGEKLPVTIVGTALHGITYTLKIASAQVKSALLLAGLFAKGTTCIKEPIPTRDHSERMIKYMDGKIETGNVISIKGEQRLQGKEIFVPSDISSAAYFIALATLVEDSEIIIPNVGVNPTRTGIIDVLGTMGANIELLNKRDISNEPVADIKVKSSYLNGIEIKGEIIPRIIDELPLIAVVATQAKGVTIVKDAKELRVKESDRIKSIVKGLSGLGAKIEEQEDGFKIIGPTVLKGNVCDSYGDHRIAMALSIAGCVADGETVIKGRECVDISFPGFWDIIKNYENFK